MGEAAQPAYVPTVPPGGSGSSQGDGSGGSGDAGSGAFDGGGDGGVQAICPPDMDASFGSIFSNMLATTSCGTDPGSRCHSATGSVSTSNLLDFTLEAGAVYAELLGADGGGRRASNPEGSDKTILRVAPYDASASLLYIKLTIGAGGDSRYGFGMPQTSPGSVCPAAVAAVKAWIDQGAPSN
jgi:hypothetical protein